MRIKMPQLQPDTPYTVGHYATHAINQRNLTIYNHMHPLDTLPNPTARMLDIAPVMLDLKTALRRIRPMEDFDAGKRAGIRYALELIKTALGEPF